MTPDREIDARIGEAFGFTPMITWQILTEDESATCMSFDRESSAIDWYERHVKEFPAYFSAYHVGSWKRYPAFSTDAAASRLLRDKLAETWTYVRVDICNVGGAISYIARAWHPGKGGFSCEADTEGKAVGKLALKSKGIEVPCG